MLRELAVAIETILLAKEEKLTESLEEEEENEDRPGQREGIKGVDGDKGDVGRSSHGREGFRRRRRTNERKSDGNEPYVEGDEGRFDPEGSGKRRQRRTRTRGRKSDDGDGDDAKEEGEESMQRVLDIVQHVLKVERFIDFYCI